MTEIETLNKKVDDLIKDFKSLPTVINYLNLKQALQEDEYLSKICEQRKKLQSSIKYLKNEKKDEAMKACKELQIEYENSPLYINYISAKEEVLKLIEPLTEAKL